MIIKEYRIPMPITVEEYQRGRVYTDAESSRRETGGGDGIEVLKNERFENVELPNGIQLETGRFTMRVYHIDHRIPMPITVEEYQRGRVYTDAESSRRETGGGDGIEVLKNERFENVELPNGIQLETGRFTMRVYHIDQKVPSYIRILTPKGSLSMKEESYSAFPYCRTVVSNDYLGERLAVTIELIHLADRGETENALNLTPEQLKLREVVLLDIGAELDPEIEAILAEDELPRTFTTKKSSKGPLRKNWIEEAEQVMCCYKVVTCEFKVFGLQQRVEHFIQKNELKIFSTVHRRMFCWMDDWIEMTLEETRRHEDDVAQELDLLRETGQLRGLRATD